MTIKLVSDTIDRSDVDALVAWLQQEPIPRLTKGELTIQLESKWNQWLGVRHTTYVNSGSSAILLALAAMQEAGMLKPGARVAVPGLSWLTDVSSVMLLGMKPVLIDCNLTDLSMDLDHLENEIKARGVAAVILVSVLGLVPNMDKIVKLCKKHGVKLIEDVCESMGSKHQGRKLGTFGDVSVFSMYYGHHLSTIEGGLVCTNNEHLHRIVHSMRSHGWDRDWPKNIQESMRSMHGVDDFQAMYTFYYPGMNVRATDLQAFLGLRQVDKLDEFAQKRNQNFLWYTQHIQNSELNVGQGTGDFVSSFAFPVLTANRDKVVQVLQCKDIEVRPLIAGSMGRQPFWTKRYGTSRSNLPHCDKIHAYGFYVPNHQDLTETDVKLICEAINQ